MIGVAIGAYLGSKNTKYEVKYVQRERVGGNINMSGLAPNFEYKPIKLDLKWDISPDGGNALYEPDSLLTSPPDTLEAIWATVSDWNTRRTYTQTLFDNAEGRLDVNLSLQYNRPQDIGWVFTPAPVPVPQIKKHRTLSPFVRASANTFGILGVGGGVYINHWGVGGSYLYDTRRGMRGFEVGVAYKF